MTTQTDIDNELVPIGTRLRWVLLCRGVLISLVPLGLLVDGADREAVHTLLVVAPSWLLLTAPTPLAARLGRNIARATFNVTLLGDGVLLCALWLALGGLDGPGGHIVWLQCAAVTLLASFRTGVKMAVWHGLLALVTLHAVKAGVLGPPSDFQLGDLIVYQATLLSTVLAIAGFAAVNERELRRRRFDSDVLRQFAFELAAERGVDEIIGMLGEFGVNQLLAPRVLVHTQRRHPETGADGDAAVALVTNDGGVDRLAAPGGLPKRSVLTRAARTSETQLVSRLDSAHDSWLAARFPGARNLIVIPFALDQICGAVVIESPQRRAGRVERRIRDTAEQSVALAAIALGRAVLTERVRSAADTDGLTGLANRRLFDLRLAKEVARARTADEPVGLVMVDLDHFKNLNDKYGHQTGDEVLRQAAQVLAAHAVDGVLAARYGGEEFALVLSGAAARLDAATAIAESIRHELWVADTVVPVTASIGVAVATGQTCSDSTLIAAADAALYEAKARGRDRVEVAGADRVLTS
ncbi:MAG TPA: GGDEF domain-containing protein [Actinoplanes sp.]|nr:GGDEF domain-containing protein [Actinoplanes sp.]